MVQRFINIIVVCLLIVFSKQVQGQTMRFSVVPKPLFGLTQKSLAGLPETRAVYSFQSAKTKLPLPSFSAGSCNVSQSLYTLQFGFFCRKELQFEKRTAIPLRFRLGSLDYVNRLEGK
jgi:hypothetical protein